MRSNREAGDSWETQCFDLLAPFLPGLKMTIGSGSVFGDQDMYNDDFRISVKLRDNGRGLTRKEIMEPYGREPVGSTRVPATIVRSVGLNPGEVVSDYVLVDGWISRRFGRDLLQLVLIDMFDDFPIVDTDEREGLTPTIMRTVGHEDILFLRGLPAERISILMRLGKFTDMVASIMDAVNDARKG